MIEINEDILESIKKEAQQNNVPILKDDSMKLITVILQMLRPNYILEIGTAVGYSAISFSKYLNSESSRILSIELKEEMYKKAIENITKVSLNNNIDVVHANAVEYLPTIDDKDNKFDFTFIDAAKGQYLIFLEQAIRLTKPGGVIVADNVLFKGRVMSDYNEHKHRTAVNRLRKYIDIINNDERLNSIVLDIGDGIAISVVK